MSRPKPKPLSRKPPATDRPEQAEGTPLPLSQASAFALRDVAAAHGLNELEAAQYAIGLWHWMSGQMAAGKHFYIADENGDNGQHVTLPRPEHATPT